jgi:hypothetical protein
MIKMAMSPADHEELANRFTYHPPKDEEQVARYQLIREHGHALATLVGNHCPASRERSLAWTKIEEAVMHANAAIARHE